MNRYDIADNFALIWKNSREDANKSQDFMAKALGVSKKTIQNWEAGYSSPSILTAIEWFEILNVPALPYFLKIIYPESYTGTDHTEELIKVVKSLTPHLQEELLYMLSGVHGSEPAGVIEMTTTHLHVPLKDRLNIAQNIVTNYEMAEAQQTLICEQQAQPNIALIKESYFNACRAVKEGKTSYSNIRDMI